MRLARPMIGVLPQDHDPHIFERGQIQGAKPFATLWKDRLARRLFGQQEGFERLHIGAFEFGSERPEPARMQPDLPARRRTLTAHAHTPDPRLPASAAFLSEMRHPNLRSQQRAAHFPAAIDLHVAADTTAPSIALLASSARTGKLAARSLAWAEAAVPRITRPLMP